MKKLMILGGSRYILPVIKAAHELNVYVITADYLPNNIAHKYSDEYCNVSIIDKEKTLEAARKMNIDGIMSFACDPGVVTAAYVADKLGLPSAGPYESICILQNKKKFREFLTLNNFNVPMAKGYVEISEALKDINLFKWPVIVKPTDSAGSKGVTKVENPNDLKKSIEYALMFSNKKEFIIEEFIAQKGFSSDTDSFSINGKLEFISFNSQRFDRKAQNPYTPAAYNWPSTISNENKKILSDELQRLISLLKMNTSIYNIETRESIDGNPYIMECSPRGGGNRLSECLKYSTGIDLIKNSVKAALNIEIDDIKQAEYNGYWGEVILHSDTKGIFKNLVISEKIQQNIVERDLWVDVGDEIGNFEAANEAIGTLILKFNTEQELNEVMNNCDKYIKVIVE